MSLAAQFSEHSVIEETGAALVNQLAPLEPVLWLGWGLDAKTPSEVFLALTPDQLIGSVGGDSGAVWSEPAGRWSVPSGAHRLRLQTGSGRVIDLDITETCGFRFSSR